MMNAAGDERRQGGGQAFCSLRDVRSGGKDTHAASDSSFANYS